MMFFEILDKLKKKSSSLIIYCLLDRIPIIVFGDNSDKIDKFLIELSDLIHFRTEYVFYTDFISKNECDNLIQSEDIDFNTQRVQIRCPCSVALKALNQFDNFNSWIIGIVTPEDKKNVTEINLIRKKIKVFLTIFLSPNAEDITHKTYK